MTVRCGGGDVDPRAAWDAVPRLQWADDRMAGAAQAPAYGSPEWCALDDTDPAKLAAAVRAAEAHRRDTDPTVLAATAAAELAELRALRAELQEEADLAAWDAYRGAIATPRPSALQLARRRRDEAAIARLVAQEARLANVEVPDGYPSTIGEPDVEPPAPVEAGAGMPDVTTMIRALGGNSGPVTEERTAAILADWDAETPPSESPARR